MNVDEAIRWAVDNKINFQFREEDDKIMLFAYSSRFHTIVDYVTWPLKMVVKNRLVSAINRLKEAEN